jgi:hypothetical protein
MYGDREKIYAKEYIYHGAFSGVPRTPYIHVQMWTAKSTSGYNGPSTPLPKKVLLKSRLQIPNSRSTTIFPLTRIPTGFALTSRSQFTLIRLSTVTGRSRFTPIRPTAGSAVCPDRPESIHTDLAHGCFSRIFVLMLSLILNNGPTTPLPKRCS